MRIYPMYENPSNVWEPACFSYKNRRLSVRKPAIGFIMFPVPAFSRILFWFFGLFKWRGLFGRFGWFARLFGILRFYISGLLFFFRFFPRRNPRVGDNERFMNRRRGRMMFRRLFWSGYFGIGARVVFQKRAVVFHRSAFRREFFVSPRLFQPNIIESLLFAITAGRKPFQQSLLRQPVFLLDFKQKHRHTQYPTFVIILFIGIHER